MFANSDAVLTYAATYRRMHLVSFPELTVGAAGLVDQCKTFMQDIHAKLVCNNMVPQTHLCT